MDGRLREDILGMALYILHDSDHCLWYEAAKKKHLPLPYGTVVQ